MFKIRNSQTGEFSKGGTSSSFVWGQKGKVWSTRGAVTSHLAQCGFGVLAAYAAADAEIVEFEMAEVSVVNVADWKEAKSTIRAKELQAMRGAEAALARKEDEIKKLKAKLAALEAGK